MTGSEFELRHAVRYTRVFGGELPLVAAFEEAVVDLQERANEIVADLSRAADRVAGRPVVRVRRPNGGQG